MKFTKTQNKLLLIFGAILPFAASGTIWFGYYAVQARAARESSTNLMDAEKAYCYGLQDTFREDRRSFCYNASIAEILSSKYPGYSVENCAQTPLFDAVVYAQGMKMDERCKPIINLENIDPRNPSKKESRDKYLNNLVNPTK